MQECCLVLEFIFFATRTTSHFAHTVSLSVSQNHTIHQTMFISVLNGAENIPLSKNIVVGVSFTHVPLVTTLRYRQLTDRGQPLDSNNTSCISYVMWNEKTHLTSDFTFFHFLGSSSRKLNALTNEPNSRP